MTTYTVIDNLAEIDMPADGILSLTPFEDDQVKIVLFGFATGEELSEHTASMPAILHILSGEARLLLGDDVMEVQAGAWIHMPARLPHSVYAKTPLVMSLQLLKAAK